MIMWLDNRSQLYLSVIIGIKDKDGNKVDYHKEYMYNSSKYSNYASIITMKRIFKYSLSINFIGKNTEFSKYDIMVNDMIPFINLINLGYKWINEYKDIYLYNNKKISINKKYNLQASVRLTYMNISIYPNIFIDKYDEYCESISIDLNNGEETINMIIPNYMGLLYTIRNLNLFIAAQNLVNYLGRPPYGENLISFTNYNINEEPESYTDIKKDNRVPKGEKRDGFNINYFDS